MSEQLPTSRKEAVAIGAKTYASKPCCFCGGTVRNASDYRCIGCRAAKQAALKQRNPGLVRSRQARWEKANLARVRRKQREWRQERLKSDPGYRAETNARMRQWRRNNPDKVAAIRNRRSLRDNGPGLSVSDLVRLTVLQNGRCAECRIRLLNGVEVDHIIPLAREGDSSIKNLQLLCPPCNRKKNAKDPLQMAQERGRLL